MNTPLKKYGLIPKALPNRHPTTHQVFGSLIASDIPATVLLPDLVGPTDQKDTSICYSYAVRQLASDQDGIVYDENFTVAKVSETAGAVLTEGAPALDAMQSAVKFGLLEAKNAPAGMTWEEKGVDFISDWHNWPMPLDELAAPREKTSVLSVNGPHDAFDNIRSAIASHKRHVALATQWFMEFNDAAGDGSVQVPDARGPYSWHMYEAMDYDVIGGVEKIRVKPHEGKGYGQNGYAWFDRQTIDLLLSNPLANALMFGDVPTSVLQRLAVQHISLEEIFEELAARIRL